MASLARSNATFVSPQPKKNRNKAGLQLPAQFLQMQEAESNTNSSIQSTASDGSSSFARNAYESCINAIGGDDALSPEVLAVGELQNDDIEVLRKLGEGAGGSVLKCLHKPTGYLMAKKLIPVDPDPEMQKQIIRELAALRRCNSPYIVSFYGAFLDGEDIAICMEFCESGSLDAIYRRVQKMKGRIGEGVLGKVAVSVSEAMVYLHQQRIIHRDVKPSNIVVNSSGQIKLCDFGVSGALIDSIAKTFLGTSYYMAPERIQGDGYNVRSDVWSLGITIIEVAMCRFPFPPPGHPPLSMFELLDYIVCKPTPQLPQEEGWSQNIRDFLRVCLIKDSALRPTPQQILTHPFVRKWADTEVDLARWTRMVWS